MFHVGKFFWAGYIMSKQHCFKMVRQIVAGAIVSIAGQNIYAATVDPLVLPPINVMTAGLYGDFYVYSLDLLQQCQAAGDPNCSPGGAYPVQAQPGQTDQALIIYMGDSWASNYNQLANTPGTEPLTIANTGDNGFTIPQGSQTTTFEMSAATEVNSDGSKVELSQVAGWTGDRIGSWEVKISALASYLGWTDATKPDANLVFLFDNNQTGHAANQWQWIWGTASIFAADGVSPILCQSLYSKGSSGCDNGNPVAPVLDANGVITNLNATNYVGIVGDFCVYKDKSNPKYGEAYNIGTGSESSCGTDYYIKNDLGQNAEFAAWNKTLEDFVRANYISNPDYVLSVNIKLAGLNDGGEQLYIPNTVFISRVPEPDTLALLGLGLFAMLVPFQRRRRG